MPGDFNEVWIRISGTGRGRLRDLPAAQEPLLTLFLAMIGAGYGVALVNLCLTCHLTDGEPGLSVADQGRALDGNRENTKLASKIDDGSMARFLPRAGDMEKILSWTQDGASEEGCRRVIRPILQQNCVRRHNPAGLQRFAPLTSCEELMAVAQVDRGKPPRSWRASRTPASSRSACCFSCWRACSRSRRCGRS